jgi:hypothetical protein
MAEAANAGDRSFQSRLREAKMASAPKVDAGILNLPFAGNKALELANADQIEFADPEVPAIDQAGRERSARSLFSQAKTASINAAGKVSEAQAKEAVLGAATTTLQMPVSTLIKTLWLIMFKTFFHASYLIVGIYFLGYIARLLNGKFSPIPEIGQAWIPKSAATTVGQAGSAGNAALSSLKYAEMVALITCTAIAILIDLILLVLLVMTMELLECTTGILSALKCVWKAVT